MRAAQKPRGRRHELAQLLAEIVRVWRRIRAAAGVELQIERAAEGDLLLEDIAQRFLKVRPVRHVRSSGSEPLPSRVTIVRDFREGSRSAICAAPCRSCRTYRPILLSAFRPRSPCWPAGWRAARSQALLPRCPTGRHW